MTGMTALEVAVWPEDVPADMRPGFWCQPPTDPDWLAKAIAEAIAAGESACKG